MLKLPTVPESTIPFPAPEPGSIQLVVSCPAFAAAILFLPHRSQMARSAALGRSGPGRTGPELWSSALVLTVLLAELVGPGGAVSEPGKWILNVDSVSFLLVVVGVFLAVS